MAERKRGNGQGTLFQRKGRGLWIAEWYNAEGKRINRSTRTTSKADAERIMRKWVERSALEREGLVAPEGGTELDRHAAASIGTHIDAFSRSKRAEGRSDKHVNDTDRMIRRTAEACGWKTLADCDPEQLERFLAKKRAVVEVDGKQIRQTWTPRTAHKCITALRTFARWCIADGRLASDPLARLKKPAPHRQRERRPLSVEEWRWLRSATEQEPERFGMPGAERALLYALALETGLRAGELRSLTRASLILGAENPHVLLSASATKNRKAARQYIRGPLASVLGAHVGNRMPGAPVFDMPSSTKTAAMIRGDLDAARRAWIADAGTDVTERVQREGADFLRSEDHDGRVIDFHALRHTCGAWAAIGGASPKAIQTLMRHSVITLTLDTYGHLLPDEAAETVGRMPDAEPIELRLTGTNDTPEPTDQTTAVATATRVRNGSFRCESLRSKPALMGAQPHGPVAELADAADLKSASSEGECGFESHRAH